MARDGEDFSLHTRPSKRGPVFYVQFGLDNGRWTNAKSTKIAVAWAQKYLDTGQVM